MAFKVFACVLLLCSDTSYLEATRLNLDATRLKHESSPQKTTFESRATHEAIAAIAMQNGTRMFVSTEHAKHACEVGWINLCLDDIDGDWWGVVLEFVLLVYSFVAVAIVADSHLVESLETLCARWNVREDVAGASFLAFGSAAPEIVINAISTFKQVLPQAGEEANDTDLGIGAIIGSGMIAFTVIPGACGLATPQPMKIKRRPLARDIGFYFIALVVLCHAFADSIIQTQEAALMLGVYAAYMLVVVFASTIRQRYRATFLGLEPTRQRSFVLEAAGQSQSQSTPKQSTEGDVEITSVVATGVANVPASPNFPEPAVSFGDIRHLVLRVAATLKYLILQPLLLLLRITCPECAHDSNQAKLYPLTLASSFVWVAVLSTIISAVVSRWGDLLHVPNSLLGMYVIALGAEIPDTIQSVTVARRGYASMAVSNCTGSQIINILVGLGLPWLISGLAGQPVRVNGHAELQVMAYFQVAIVGTYTSLVLCTSIHTWRRGDHRKASLGRCRGTTLICVTC